MLVIVVLVLFPIQWVWGAAAPYCAHETRSVGKQHFGHHEHQHQSAESASQSGDSNDTRSADHPDCATCHLGAGSLVSQPSWAVLTPRDRVCDDHGRAYRSHVPSTPERPDRYELTAAARFAGGVEFGPHPA